LIRGERMTAEHLNAVLRQVQSIKERKAQELLRKRLNTEERTAWPRRNSGAGKSPSLPPRGFYYTYGAMFLVLIITSFLRYSGLVMGKAIGRKTEVHRAIPSHGIVPERSSPLPAVLFLAATLVSSLTNHLFPNGDSAKVKYFNDDLTGGNFGYLKITIDAKVRSLTCEFMRVKDGKAVSLNSYTISI
jgi:hypothetical protein